MVSQQDDWVDYLQDRARGLLPVIYACVAFGTSLMSSFWCQTIVFSSELYPPLAYGLWFRQEFVIYTIRQGSELYIDAQQKCVDYDSDYDVGPIWYFARASTVVAPAVGGIGAIIAFFSALFYILSKKYYRMLAWTYVCVVAPAQGCTFFLYMTSLCDQGVDITLQAVVELRGGDGEYSGCQWDSGSTANAAATLAWLLTGLFMLNYYPHPDKEDGNDRKDANDIDQGKGEQENDTHGFDIPCSDDEEDPVRVNRVRRQKEIEATPAREGTLPVIFPLVDVKKKSLHSESGKREARQSLEADQAHRSQKEFAVDGSYEYGAGIDKGHGHDPRHTSTDPREEWKRRAMQDSDEESDEREARRPAKVGNSNKLHRTIPQHEVLPIDDSYAYATESSAMGDDESSQKPCLDPREEWRRRAMQDSDDDSDEDIPDEKRIYHEHYRSSKTSRLRDETSIYNVSKPAGRSNALPERVVKSNPVELSIEDFSLDPASDAYDTAYESIKSNHSSKLAKPTINEYENSKFDEKDDYGINRPARTNNYSQDLQNLVLGRVEI